jgi:hypothetical protein
MPAAAIVGSSIIGGIMGNKAASKQASASRDATAMSIEEQRRQFDLQREDTAPYRQAGVNALTQLQNSMGASGAPLPEYTPTAGFSFDESKMASSPAYQFQLQQGLEAVNRGAAKGGNLGAGNRLLELQRFGQGLAAQSYGDEFQRQFATNQDAYNRNIQGYGLNYQRGQDMYGRGQNYLNRLSSLAGVGQTAVQQSGAAGMTMAGNIGNAAMQNATNQGSAAALKYGSANQAIQGGMQNYMMYNMMNPGGGATASPTIFRA